MDKIDFIKVFDDVAKSHGFVSKFGGWFFENEEAVAVLDLQKSKYGNYYDLNLKIFLIGVFKEQYEKSKALVKKDVGDIFSRQPLEYNEVFNLENNISIDRRRELLKTLFKVFVMPFLQQTMNKTSLKRAVSQNELFVLPAVKDALGL